MISPIIDFLMNQPGIRGIWPLTSYRANGEARDLLGELHLARTGVTLDVADGAHSSYFSTTSERLNHADTAALDIIGNEAYVSNNLRGMTVGLWVRLENNDVQQQITSKWLFSGNQRSWFIDVTSGANVRFLISGDGSNNFLISTTTAPILPERWHLIVARYRSDVPDITIWVDLEMAVNATSIPSTIFNGTAAFRIGQREDGTAGFVGHARFAFLAHAAWPDHIVEEFATLSAPHFGLSLGQVTSKEVSTILQLTPAVQHSIHAPQPITWPGTSLIGATLTGRIRSLKSGVTRNIEGTLTITSAVNGRFSWDYDPADVVESGKFEVQFTANFNQVPHKHLVANWKVAPSI